MFVLNFMTLLAAPLDVPMIYQNPELPTGCEATALTMLLNDYGYEIDKIQVANDIPKVPLPSSKNGQMYGGHPDDGFVGNPFVSAAYGVYSSPIVDMIDTYLPGQAEDLTGKTFEDILEVIDSGRPVMVWVTISLVDPFVNRSWYTRDGEYFSWLANEHTMILTGYDENYVYVNDPLRGKNVTYNLKRFEKMWYDMGSMAVAIKSPYSEHTLEIGELQIPVTLLLFEESYWLPIRTLPLLDERFEVDYIPPSATLTFNDMTYSLHPDHDRILFSIDDAEVELHYLYRDNTCYIALDAVQSFIPLNLK